MTHFTFTARHVQCVQGDDFLRKSPRELGGFERLRKEKWL